MTDEESRYGPGDPVRVRADARPGHVRTPGYIRGRAGRVERVHGAFRNPESLAYGGDGLPKRPLYQVCFRELDVWAGYAGASADRICVDLYEHWLEPS